MEKMRRIILLLILILLPTRVIGQEMSPMGTYMEIIRKASEEGISHEIGFPDLTKGLFDFYLVDLTGDGRQELIILEVEDSMFEGFYIRVYSGEDEILKEEINLKNIERELEFGVLEYRDKNYLYRRKLGDEELLVIYNILDRGKFDFDLVTGDYKKLKKFISFSDQESLEIQYEGLNIEKLNEFFKKQYLKALKKLGNIEELELEEGQKIEILSNINLSLNQEVFSLDQAYKLDQDNYYILLDSYKFKEEDYYNENLDLVLKREELENEAYPKDLLELFKKPRSKWSDNLDLSSFRGISRLGIFNKSDKTLKIIGDREALEGEVLEDYFKKPEATEKKAKDKKDIDQKKAEGKAKYPLALVLAAVLVLALLVNLILRSGK